MHRPLTRSSLAPLVAERAHGLRAGLTDSEQQLSRSLAAKKLGVSFRKQVPIGRYIVDFHAPSARLIIEVDGPYHARRRKADARRDDKLRRSGYRVLRLEAELVARNLPEALLLIRAALAEPA